MSAAGCRPEQGLGLQLPGRPGSAGAVAVCFTSVRDGAARYRVSVEDGHRRELGASEVAVPLAQLPDPRQALRLAVLGLLELVPGDGWPTEEVRRWVAGVRRSLEAAVDRLAPSVPDEDAQLLAEARVHLREAQWRTARDPDRYADVPAALAEIRREHAALGVPEDLLLTVDLAQRYA